METLTDAIYRSAIGQAIQNNDWVIPTVQSIHILAIAVLMGSALLLNLRVAGFLAQSAPAVVVFRRFMPRMWWALSVLVSTGLVMVVGEPERVLNNRMFWTKMTLVAISVVLTSAVRQALLRPRTTNGSTPSRPLERILGLGSLLVWIAIIFCGRWIAYTQ